MEGVELIACHLGDERFQIIEGDEGTRRVDHQLTYMGAGSVLYGELRDDVHAFLVAAAAQNLV